MKADDSEEARAFFERIREAYPLADKDKLLASKPMRFGSEFDFWLAVAELKWLKQKNGRVPDDDIRQAAVKYCVPKGMLANGLEDRLKHPKDFMIRTSPWFPVLYAWAVGDETAQNDLFLKRVRYYHAGFYYFLALLLVPLLTGGLALSLWNTLQSFGYNFADILKAEAFLLPAVPFYINLLVNLGSKVEDNFRQLREQVARMDSEGRGAIVLSVLQFLESKLGSQYLSSSFFLRKSDEEILRWYSSKPHLYVYHMGFVDVKDLPVNRTPERQSSWRFFRLKRSHKSTKTSTEAGTTHKVPMGLAEDPHEAYRERMKAVLTKAEAEDSNV